MPNLIPDVGPGLLPAALAAALATVLFYAVFTRVAISFSDVDHPWRRKKFDHSRCEHKLTETKFRVAEHTSACSEKAEEIGIRRALLFVKLWAIALTEVIMGVIRVVFPVKFTLTLRSDNVSPWKLYGPIVAVVIGFGVLCWAAWHSLTSPSEDTVIRYGSWATLGILFAAGVAYVVTNREKNKETDQHGMVLDLTPAVLLVGLALVILPMAKADLEAGYVSPGRTTFYWSVAGVIAVSFAAGAIYKLSGRDPREMFVKKERA